MGFLSIPGTKTTGNYGLFDQVAALKWIKSNIESFGGDPAMVTIFGESVGSVSVSLHLISSLNKGLFKRAISESVAANSPGGVSRPDQIDSYAKSYGPATDCADLKKLLECLRPKSSKDILLGQEKFSPITRPNVDKHFLYFSPWELITKNPSDFRSDFIYEVPTVEFVNAWTKANEANKAVYAYRFSHFAKYATAPFRGVTQG